MVFTSTSMHSDGKHLPMRLFLIAAIYSTAATHPGHVGWAFLAPAAGAHS
jgi:hypothetical protein